MSTCFDKIKLSHFSTFVNNDSHQTALLKCLLIWPKLKESIIELDLLG